MIEIYRIIGISRGSIRIWGCKRAVARLHPQIRGFTTASPEEPTWTWPIGRGKIAFAWTLGVRLVVGQRTLTPYAEVRILDPQPDPPVRRLQNSLIPPVKGVLLMELLDYTGRLPYKQGVRGTDEGYSGSKMPHNDKP
jgi:hypothetical protein